MSHVVAVSDPPPRTGASFARGSSRQDYATPRDFIAAVEKRFGKVAFDLAAEPHNVVGAGGYFDESADALRQDWFADPARRAPALLWLNPPFARIAPWAEKCRYEAARGCRIAFLVPAAVGANWWRDFVHGRAGVYFLNGRLKFDGKNGFPKDCALCVFGDKPGYHVWDWRRA